MRNRANSRKNISSIKIIGVPNGEEQVKMGQNHFFSLIVDENLKKKKCSLQYCP